jgi:hypothetical protein
MTVLALTTKMGDSVEFTDDEVTIAKTRTFNLPDNHLIKVTTCWRSMSSTDGPSMVTLSITDKDGAHKQEQNHRIDSEGVGQAGGEMSRVLKVSEDIEGDIIPGRNRFELRAARVDSTSDGTIVIQADAEYPIEIRVEDLGVIPSHL